MFDVIMLFPISLPTWPNVDILCKMVVGTATRYGLDGPGIESRGGEIFRTRPDRPRGPSCLLYNVYRVNRRGKVAGE